MSRFAGPPFAFALAKRYAAQNNDPSNDAMASRKYCLGLLQRCECTRPTRRGWLAIALGVGVIVVAGVMTAQPFLAVTAPVSGGVLVVEGWAPDYVMQAAREEFHRNPYVRLIVAGGPIEHGEFLSEYHDYAKLGAAVLIQQGESPENLMPVPAPFAKTDRTYTSAVEVRKWLVAHQLGGMSVNVVTLGAHARRSRLLYEKAWGAGATVGVIAVPERGYDAARWWQSSAGFRRVIDELVGYLYARLLFFPDDRS